MTEFTKRYYPTVCIRRAEMKALENLPSSEKLKMLPVVLLAPWLNSIEFDNTFRVIERSIGSGPVIVDIDRFFESDSTLPSRQYYRELVDPIAGPDKWIELIKDHPNYIPCIQIAGISDDLISKQILSAKALERGFVFRIELNRVSNLDSIFNFISDNKNENILVIFDYGYNDKQETVELQLSDLIDRLLGISIELKFVISGTNFPNSFSAFDNFAAAESIYSRTIYNNLSRKYGNYSFYYGDWASTKPRSYDGGGTPIPRIDFPTANSWIIARSKEDEWDFQTAAEMILRLPEWNGRPMVWGTGMIEKSAKGLPGGISTGPQAIASRVNIHLYLQNNFGAPPAPEAPKGKWIDPI